MFCLIAAGVALLGINDMPNQINGAYGPSCGTSYCRAAHTYCTPQAPASSILNHPTGYGYSVDYNYGLEPAPAATWSGSSHSYNYGKTRLK